MRTRAVRCQVAPPARGGQHVEVKYPTLSSGDACAPGLPNPTTSHGPSVVILGATPRREHAPLGAYNDGGWLTWDSAGVGEGCAHLA